MLDASDAFAHLLCKLCWHNPLRPSLLAANVHVLTLILELGHIAIVIATSYTALLMLGSK